MTKFGQITVKRNFMQGSMTSKGVSLGAARKICLLKNRAGEQTVWTSKSFFEAFMPISTTVKRVYGELLTKIFEGLGLDLLV